MLSITGAVYGINPERLVKEETARYITAVFNGFEYGAFIQITGDDIHQGVSVLTDRVITTGMQKKIEDELAERIQYALDKNCPILKTREVNTNIIVDMKKLRRDEIILSIGVSVEISVTPKKAVGLCTAKITTWFPLHETVYRKQI